MTEEQRKILGPVEWIALIAGVGLLAYILLYQKGVKVIEKTVEVEFIDPKTSHRLEAPPREERRAAPASENLLLEMAEVFEQQPVDPTDGENRWGLTPEEADFYDQLRQAFAEDERVQSAKDWWERLVFSRKAYLRLQELAATLAPKKGAEGLGNTRTSEQFYEQVTQWYPVSETELETFAREGQRSIADWATFLTLRQYDRYEER